MMLISDYPYYNTVKVGSLYLKPESVNETITHCCRMVLRESGDLTLPLWRSGSATLVRYAGINYVIMTRHQLLIQKGMEPPEDIVTTIRVSSGLDQLKNIPIQKCLYETSNPEEEYHDILIFEVASTWKNQEIDAPYFFPLGPFKKTKRITSLVVGYPSIGDVMEDYHDNFYSKGESKENAEKGKIHLKRMIGDCVMDERFKSNAEYFRRYIQNKSRPHMDGFSGGAIFSLIGEISNMEIVLDGIILRANEQYVHIVDVDYLMKAVTRQR